MADDAQARTARARSLARVDALLDARRVDPAALAEEPLVALGHVEAELRSIEARLADVERARRLGAEVPRSLLLSGPTGIGKTHTARALARRLGLPVYELAVDDLTAPVVRAVFARLAERHERSVLVVDEIDLVGAARDQEPDAASKRTLSALLTELDGLRPATGVLLVAATSQPVWALDEALTRAGRLGFTIVLRLPDAGARRAMLELWLGGRPTAPDVDPGPLADMAEGPTPADLRAAVADAAGIALAAGRDEIAQADLVAALERAGRVLPDPEPGPVDEAELRRVCVHEAAHAVVGAALHGPARLRSAEIGEHAGAVAFAGEPGEGPGLDERTARDAVATALAGYLGERALLGSAHLAHGRDAEAATGLACRLVEAGLDASSPPADLDHPLLRGTPAAARAADAAFALLAEARERAGALVGAHRAAIAAVADRLAAEALPRLAADRRRLPVAVDAEGLRAELARLLAPDGAAGAAR